MASLSVKWSNNSGNFDELQSFLNHNTQILRCGGMYNRLRNYNQICKAQRTNCNLIVNNLSGMSSAISSSAARSDEHLSSSYSSGFDHSVNNKIYSTRKRMVDKEEDFSGKLDQWVKDSVVEIVNYLDEAPFLAHIYSDGVEGCNSKSRNKNKLVKEKAVPESWPLIKERWVVGGSPTPNGIILVEEMKCKEEGDCPYYKECLKKLEMTDQKLSSSSSTKVWGILIQGKGANYPACYLLKTSRVACVSGFCTHFCLVRVENFIEHLDILFRKLWLL